MCANGVGNPMGIGFPTWSGDPTTVRRGVLRELLWCQKPDNVTLAIGKLIPCRRLGLLSWTVHHREDETKKKTGQNPGKVVLESGSG